MGIRLEWDIETDHNTYRADDDPRQRRARRQARLVILAGALFVAALIAGLVALARERLRQLDRAEEQVLIDTVTAEIAALRIGDRAAYLGFFRSADAAWLTDQRATFDIYQDLKRRGEVELIGQVEAVAIDGQRGRVQVTEIRDGVPYTHVQFYWDYPDDGDDSDDLEDGWRRVPPDYSFWGAPAVLEGQHVTVTYREVDSALAQSASALLDSWLATGCAALNCPAIPALRVEIRPEPGGSPRWSDSAPWLLSVPSPYTDRARADMPFDPDLRFQVAALLAERLIADALAGREPRFPYDAYYLRQGVASWLVGRFVQINTNSFLIDSLTTLYGADAPGDLLAVLQPDSDVDVITAVTGTTLDAASLDWRDFLTWRLALENDLIARQDWDNFSWLYKFQDPGVLETATDRYQLGPMPDVPVVIGTQPAAPSPEGSPRLLAITQRPGDSPTQGQVLFELVDNVWKRVS